MNLWQNADFRLASRMLPYQKARLIEKFKKHFPNKVTMAVGDGNNDVSMIQEAHLGIGIRGNEGTHAVDASDFAISYLKQVKRLLAVHGREAHRRNTFLAEFFFYKSTLLSALLFFFGSFSEWSG